MPNIMKCGVLAAVLFVISISVCGAGYGLNIYKLTQCDFKAPYKAEVIRTVGLIPPIGAVAGWIDIGTK